MQTYTLTQYDTDIVKAFKSAIKAKRAVGDDVQFEFEGQIVDVLCDDAAVNVHHWWWKKFNALKDAAEKSPCEPVQYQYQDLIAKEAHIISEVVRLLQCLDADSMRRVIWFVEDFATRHETDERFE